jgi:hypothetical protein
MAFVCSHDVVDKCVSRTSICYLIIKQAFGSEFSMYVSPSVPYVIFCVDLLFPLTRIQRLMVHTNVFLEWFCVSQVFFFNLNLVVDAVPVTVEIWSCRPLHYDSPKPSSKYWSFQSSLHCTVTPLTFFLEQLSNCNVHEVDSLSESGVHTAWGAVAYCEKRLLTSLCLSVCMEQLGFHWKDFHGIWYLSIFRKPAEKIQVWLKSDKNNGHFTWRPMYLCDSIRHFVVNIYFSPPKIVPFMRKCGKIWYCRTGHRWQDNTTHALCMLEN